MALDWFVQHPELILEPITLGAQHQPYYAGASFTNDTRESSGRLVVFPAIIWRQQRLHASAQQDSAEDRFTFITAAAETWKAIFPDILPRLRRPDGLFSYAPLVNLPAAPVQWKPHYPDLIAKPVWRRPNQLSPELFPTTVVTFGWKVTFPDQIARVRIRPDALTQSVLGWQAIGTTKIEWEPTYPDLHWRVGFPSVLQQTFVQNLEPIPNPPSPDLAWGPRFDDWIARAPRSPWFQSSADDPRIMPPSPDLAWRVTAPDWIARKDLPVSSMPAEFFQQIVLYPDLRMDWQAPPQEPRRRVSVAQGFTARPLETPVSPVVWMNQRHNPPVVRRRQALFGGTTAPSALVVIGTNNSWQARSPVLHRRPPRLTAGSGMATVQPVLPVPNSWCVMFSDDAIIAPALKPDRLALPALANVMVRTPMLTSEQVC